MLRSKQKSVEKVPITKISKKKIIIIELDYLKKEMRKDPLERDQEKIHKIISGLEFFKKYPYDVQVKMLSNAILAHYKKGKVVYNAGDFDTFIYVILRGSVNELKRVKNQYNEYDNILIDQLFDGQGFGDNDNEEGDMQLVERSNTV